MKRFLAVLNLVASVVVALLVDILKPDALSNSEQYFLGLAIFVALTVFEVLLFQQSIDARIDAAVAVRHRENLIIEAREDLDRQVLELQRHFNDLVSESRGETDLFLEYHKKKLHDLELSLKDACVKKQVQIDETMFAVTSWLYGSAFRGSGRQILRAVLPTNEIGFFFDVHARMYFQQMYDLVRRGDAGGVKRLIVLDDGVLQSEPRLARLIAFHNSVEGYSCRGIAREAFERIMSDYRVQHLVVDFGIYGERYLYKALTNGRRQIVGIYSKDASEIKQFTECFQACWETGKGLRSGESVPATDQISWLFDDDLMETRPDATVANGADGVEPLDAS